MNRYAIAAALMWGLAVGAFAYRYGVLPFGWTSPWKHIMPGIAIGLAVGARQLWRDDTDSERRRPPVPLLIALGLVGALVSFGLSYLAFPTFNRASIATRELPGFSLALPSGEVVEDRHDYAMGKLALKNAADAGGVVIVTWEPGESMSTDDMKLVGEMLSKAIGGGGTSTLTKVTGPGGTAVDTLVFEGDMTLMMTALGCGGRHVLVATGGRDGAPSLHERIVASFVCKPDPTQEAHARISFPLVLDLPGWWLSEDAPDQLQITNGAAVLSLRAQEPNLKVDIAMIVEPMFKAAGVEGHITSKQGDRVNITMSDGSDSMAGWVRLVPCPTATAFVLALAPDAATLDELYSKVTSGRCLRSGESPQQWPTKPQ